ncbi:type II toxin-antitoxin system ParD family antitoxin [Nitrospirillum sp. BR 11164]|uniref:ribbon-helix-helix domain-containing protein n=1 Tax=Nitrospirillum sp. BR 11164 TaxID=3104324 RepID=UPI002B001259|nr:type II toxin-antitoxin system ParD family antitoxin [Nitrospirillum sp. BR 11164]MEA1649174.1 type II toxin-antitoxin system ParD family antitoxin [Nitrospirillum sp. BR 11164]
MTKSSTVAKLSIALTPELADAVKSAVASGDYASDSEVIREALREWKQRRAPVLHGETELRRLWAEGLASGAGRFDDIDAIKREARRRLESRTASTKN